MGEVRGKSEDRLDRVAGGGDILEERELPKERGEEGREGREGGKVAVEVKLESSSFGRAKM